MTGKTPIVAKRRPTIPTRKTTTTISTAKPLSTTEEEIQTVTATKRTRKPIVPGKMPVPPAQPKKEVDTHDTQTKEVEQQSEPRPSQEASKPIVASGRQSNEAEPRPTDTREEDFAQSARISIQEMKAMTIEERYKLFRSLNTNNERFVPLRKQLPKSEYMRKDEAILRGMIEKTPPKVKTGMKVLYCPYCAMWQPYHYHAWTGYNKCCGCTISTKDFYTNSDNNLAGNE